MSGVEEAAIVLVAAIAAQWIAWRLHIPGILVLLATGLALGPGLGILHVDELLGKNLEPFIALSVAIILFEGGLGLRWREIRAHGPVVAGLVTVGVLVTASIGAVAGVFLLDLAWDMALLLGAILTVSGPTVVLPLLRHIRADKESSAILRWEGILIDPIGAVFALVVLQALLAGGSAEGTGVAAVGFLRAMAAGTAIGISAGLFIAFLESRFLVPDALGAGVGLAAVVGSFALADVIQPESGLVAVTVMGIVLANQKIADIRHILDFKEDLSQILLGLLFILLAARIPRETILSMDAAAFLFVAVLVFIARPLAVALSSWRAHITMRQRAFLAWMAPRGIVAAAVSAFFAIRLEEAGREDGAILVPVTFLTIVVTVLLYAVTARPLARLLGVAGPSPHGVLVIGANSIARTVVKPLQAAGIPHLLVDTNQESVQAANTEGLHAIQGDALDARFAEKHGLEGLGTMWALTPNRTTNALACVHFADEFGRGNVHQILVQDDDEEMEPHLRGRPLWMEGATYNRLRGRIRNGWRVAKTRITDEFDVDDWRAEHGPDAVWMYVLRDHEVHPVSAGEFPSCHPGDTLVGFVPPREQ